MPDNRRKMTLRFKFLAGFIGVMVPLIVFLFYNNYYAMNVVREQVSKSNVNLLSTQVVQNDKELEQTASYLLHQANSDIMYPNLFALTSSPPDSGEYFFAKQTLLRLFVEDQDAYKLVDTFFAYPVGSGELIASQRTYEDYQRYSHLLSGYLQDKDKLKFLEWTVVSDGGRNYLVHLVRVERTDPEVYIGAVVDVRSLMAEQGAEQNGTPLETLLISNSGVPLLPTNLTNGDIRKIEDGLDQNGEEPYRKFIRSSDGLEYLVVSALSRQAPFHMIATIPEHSLLQQLPYFQLAIYLIPIVGLIIVLIYSFLLKRTLLQPMHALMSGMRRITHGDWNVRLKEGSTLEFAFLIDTFNGMVRQISELKIDVYEGLLKKREAEVKHLQAQINPHFYLNSLNIIYSLTALRRYELVEKMTEHLADYFRFITRTNREYVTLAEEIEHVANYLEIQALRFPDKLTYRIRLPDRYKSCLVPPLTVQPFVENAVIHGMPEGARTFAVEIAVAASPGREGLYEVAVSDDGKGLAPDKLCELRAGGAEDAGRGAGGLGIWNVSRRLDMIYGNRARILFGNGEAGGALVRLLLPERTELEGGEADV